MAQINLTPAQRKDHRAEAHHLNPVVMIGSDGLTDAVKKETDEGSIRRFQIIEEELEKLIMSAPNLFSANSKEILVLVLFSKNRLAIVISRNVGTFFIGLFITSLK